MTKAPSQVPFPASPVKPQRIQLSRRKGWRMPPDTVKVTRPGKWGNPFKIGGWFMVGDPYPNARFGMSWCQAANADIASRTPGKFTLIDSSEKAVEFFRRLTQRGYFSANKLADLRGKNLACWCPIGSPCHADVLLELANGKAADAAKGVR